MILRETNEIFDMNSLPDIVEFDLRYCVLDYSNVNDVDFYFPPLLFLDSFPRPSCDLKVGPYRIQMPQDWSIIIADKNLGHMEIIELKDLRDRPFEAFVMNPISGYMPQFHEITQLNLFPDVTWNMPKLKYGHILAVPLERKKCPNCVFCAKDVHRLPESLDLTKVFS